METTRAGIAIYKINYQSDFILTVVCDVEWETPFCIKFWTGEPSQAYYVGWTGTEYKNCKVVESDPSKLLVLFDDHHLPVGELKMQIVYHTTIEDFPNAIVDEVTNSMKVIAFIDGKNQKIALDFEGEEAAELQFELPAYANEAQRIANEEQRIANEQQRVQNEETRIANEETRQRNEATRIAQEEARVSEFARLKRESQQATTDANDAATLANQKAQLAQDKAALAQEAATLANQKAQLAADKAALANDAAQLANEKAALAQQKAEYAQQQGGYAKDQGDYAKDQGDYAKAQGTIAEEDHQRAEADHGIASDDHTQAGNDHTRAEADHGIASDDHTQAGNDHTRAESDHGIAADDHTQAGNDHTRAEADHGIAADDHTQAGNDHTRAESDHTRAENDHAAVEVYVDSLGAFDISSYHATGGVLAKYADLTAALGTGGANIPEAIRKGGMSVKFVHTSDNKYVQYRLMSDTFNTTPTNWQGLNNIEETDDGKFMIKDENGNIVFVIDAHGLKARKYNICDSEGNVVGTLDKTVLDALLAKQDQLVSGVNIATVNGENLLEGGNIDIGGIQDDNFPRFSISDENGNIALILNGNGLSVRRLNIADENGNIIGIIDSDFFGADSIQDDIVVNEEFHIDGDAVKAKVFAKRSTWRNAFITNNSKTVYWDITNGLDTNDGLSETNPVQSFARAKELLVNGDTLLIKRGSIITYECDFGTLKGLRIDAYGDIELDNPVFDNFVVLTGWEKVAGYNNIYKASRNYAASLGTEWNCNFMQCFIDGHRLGTDISSANALADKVSCRDIISYDDAMTYLDAHPDDACWFDGYERNEGELPQWQAGTHYWYVSLSDAPSNHIIEVSNNICLSLCRLSSCEYIDISNISQRGMPDKDGWQIGHNVIMENCKSIDQANYGFVLLGGSWYCINCDIISRSGAVNTQFHYFGDTPSRDYGSEYAFIDCSVLLNTEKIMSSKGFGGHYTDAHTNRYVTENIYILNCRCEGVEQCVTGYKSKNTYIKDLEAVGVRSINAGKNTIIDGVKGTVIANNTTFVWIDSTDITKLRVCGAVLKFISGNTTNRAGFISIDQSQSSMDNCPLNAVFKDCRFILDKGYGYQYNFITPAASDITFENCNFSVDSDSAQYISPRPAATNLKFKDCRFYGIENNLTATGVIDNCQFKGIEMMGNHFGYVDNGIIKQLKY